ncbi:hypothetical protein RB620_25810 [Paenibacillus sp. LHD-117]|uniref:hypothetical protein n=1 Tax=Paenibacillus sp. LHD-117 TaxID=3071412 RepID=UPI0027E0DAB7|nr:hypothetical protein [Paenibacillus sp. LHD-117]MDQ6422848.1 hypothetical protein [Paenibacillus sp. LHD-117]
MRLDAASYQTVPHVHDEVGAELGSPEELDRMLAIMAEPIAWAPGLPLKGGVRDRVLYEGQTDYPSFKMISTLCLHFGQGVVATNRFSLFSSMMLIN